MDQSVHTAQTYDFRQYDRIWQRVAPNLEPYPPGMSQTARSEVQPPFPAVQPVPPARRVPPVPPALLVRLAPLERRVLPAPLALLALLAPPVLPGLPVPLHREPP